jgi:glyoxylase-like metal-dependent hydrolase (beta-lactamase superfamily II)
MNPNPTLFRAAFAPVTRTRRQLLTSLGAATVAGLLLPRLLFSKEPPTSPVIVMRKAAADATIVTTKLRGNLSLLEGAGGNITALSGPEGLVLVDAGITAARPQITAALAKLGGDPVRLLVNTHWHFDHTDGNEWLQRAGARIVAHTNTVRRLSATVRVEGWNFTFEPSPGAAVPTVHFERELRMRANGQNLALESYAPGHTDTDLSVYFEGADVLSVGDTWWNGHYPFIDYSTGGSIDGTIQAAETNLRRAGGSTLVVPGHGPAGGRAELTAFRDMLVDVREAVANLKRQGRSLAETVAAKPTQRYDAKWGGFVIDPATFTALVYQGV